MTLKERASLFCPRMITDSRWLPSLYSDDVSMCLVQTEVVYFSAPPSWTQPRTAWDVDLSKVMTVDELQRREAERLKRVTAFLLFVTGSLFEGVIAHLLCSNAVQCTW